MSIVAGVAACDAACGGAKARADAPRESRLSYAAISAEAMSVKVRSGGGVWTTSAIFVEPAFGSASVAAMLPAGLSAARCSRSAVAISPQSA
jgi:hypothetical protein